MGEKEQYEKELSHPDPEVRWIAVQGLEESRGEESIDLLMHALRDQDYSSIRWRAAIALGHRRDPRAVTHLIEALSDSNLHVREEAATALGAIGDPGAVPPLITLLEDPARSVRFRAQEALVRIGDPAREALQNALELAIPPVQDKIREALTEIGEDIG
jgi:HEAT repeat protein